MSRKDKQIEKIRRAVEKVAKEYNIKRVELFGSYANGTQTRKSDIDLLVDFDNPTMSLFGVFRIQRAFEEALGKKVDLVESPIPKSSFIIIDKVVPLYG